MIFGTIDSLRESLADPGHPQRSPEYVARMIHEVPDAVVVDRVKFVLGRAEGKVVLDVGASGALHEALCKAAKRVIGIDRPTLMNEHQRMYVGHSALVSFDEARNPGPLQEMFFIDLDDVNGFVPLCPAELIVCGEVIEHLGNPLHFLTRLRRTYPSTPVIVTVPNAFADIGRRHLERNEWENVNIDHVAWYSWRTLKTLVERAGYAVKEVYWYNGRPLFAEGLIFVME